MRQTGGKVIQSLDPSLEKVNVMLTAYLLCFTVRAEKEKMNEKIKEGEQQEEVDDSGFFAGKRVIPPFCF